MQLLFVNCFSTNLLEARLKTKALNKIAAEKKILEEAVEKA